MVKCAQCGDENMNIMVTPEGRIVVFCLKNMHDVCGFEADPEFYETAKEVEKDAQNNS